MQTTGQVECKWVVKSVQLGTEEPNPYWVTVGNDMSEPIDNLK